VNAGKRKTNPKVKKHRTKRSLPDRRLAGLTPGAALEKNTDNFL
jgi:hypothetical protein